MSRWQARVLRFRKRGTIEAAQSPEAAGEAALAELAQLVAFDRAGVMVWGPDGAEPQLLAMEPPDAMGGPATDPLACRSGSLVSLPLGEGARQVGFLAFYPRGAQRLDHEVHERARDLARRLTDALAKLDASAAREGTLADTEPTATLRARIAELEHENARLRDARTELESFVHSVSHDLIAPVRTIRAATQTLVDMLHSSHTPTEHVRTQAGHADEAAARLGALVDDLAAYNQLGRMGERRLPLDLHEVVDEAMAQLANEIERTGARLTVERPLPEVLGHHGTLVQAVMNLLTNAIKFVAPGVQPHVRIHGAVDITRAWLGVTDNGIGMREDHTERIFRAFERIHGHDAYPGTGLGLAIVHRGIARLDGQVAVRSTPGRGSTFWIALPRPVAHGPRNLR